MPNLYRKEEKSPVKMPEVSRQNTFVIGDVHGCLHTLKALIAELPKDANII